VTPRLPPIFHRAFVRSGKSIKRWMGPWNWRKPPQVGCAGGPAPWAGPPPFEPLWTPPGHPPPLSLRRGSSPGGCRAAWNVGRCRDGGNAPGSSPQIRSRMEDFPEFSSPTTMIRGSLRVGCRPGNGARLEAMLAGGWYNSPLKIFDPWQNDGQAPKTNFEGGGKIS